jgi:hypothetical protein
VEVEPGRDTRSLETAPSGEVRALLPFMSGDGSGLHNQPHAVEFGGFGTVSC